MSAYLSVVTDPKDWEVIQRCVLSLNEGGILVGPDKVKEFKEKKGIDLTKHDGDFIEDYDFGGEAGLWLDVVNAVDGFQGEAVQRHVNGG